MKSKNDLPGELSYICGFQRPPGSGDMISETVASQVIFR